MSDTAAEMLYLYLLGLAIIFILVFGTWRASAADGRKKARIRHRDRRLDLESELSPPRLDPDAPRSQPTTGGRSVVDRGPSATSTNAEDR
jgi:hypothetical protein